MTWLLIGIALFFGMHLVPTVPPLKEAMQSRLGAGGYKGLFSLVSLAGLGLMIWGRAHTGHYAIFAPPAWGKTAAFILMLPAFILLAAAHMKGRIRKITRHPMLLGVLLWAGAHVLANGDLISLWLFGSFAVFSLVDMALVSGRGAPADFTVKPRQDIMAIIGGAAVYAGFIFFAHQFLFGVKLF